MDLPEFRALSKNACPNSGIAAIGLRAVDLHDGLTTFGYCGLCWTAGLIPPAWATRVADHLEVHTL